VRASLTFAHRTDEKPYTYVGEPPAGVPQSRGEYRSHAVRIENARPFAERLSLDVEAIALVRRATAVRDFWDEAQTLALGHPETAQLVKEVSGASRVVVFDHTLRRRQEGAADRAAHLPRQPASRAHVDQTIASGSQRVRDIMGKQADALLAGRAPSSTCGAPLPTPRATGRWPWAMPAAPTPAT